MQAYAQVCEAEREAGTPRRAGGAAAGGARRAGAAACCASTRCRRCGARVTRRASGLNKLSRRALYPAETRLAHADRVRRRHSNRRAPGAPLAPAAHHRRLSEGRASEIPPPAAARWRRGRGGRGARGGRPLQGPPAGGGRGAAAGGRRRRRRRAGGTRSRRCWPTPRRWCTWERMIDGQRHGARLRASPRTALRLGDGRGAERRGGVHLARPAPARRAAPRPARSKTTWRRGWSPMRPRARARRGGRRRGGGEGRRGGRRAQPRVGVRGVAAASVGFASLTATLLAQKKGGGRAGQARDGQRGEQLAARRLAVADLAALGSCSRGARAGARDARGAPGRAHGAAAGVARHHAELQQVRREYDAKEGQVGAQGVSDGLQLCTRVLRSINEIHSGRYRTYRPLTLAHAAAASAADDDLGGGVVGPGA